MTDMTRDEALEHFGVKGQKWGVRNEDKLVGRDSAKKAETGSDKAKQNELTKKYMAVKPPKYTKEEDARQHAESKAKFHAKFVSEDTKQSGADGLKDWRPTKKQVATVALGAAAVGLIVYGVKSGKFNEMGDAYSKSVAKWNAAPGEPISAGAFNLNVSKSVSNSWGAGGYIKPSSYAQQGATFEAGHVFHRLTDVAETKFNPSTYCTDSIEDFNRYVTAFRHEKPWATEFQHVTWSAKEQIKVPSMTTTLETMRNTLTERFGSEATHEQAISFYNQLSGGEWSHSDPVVKNFFSKLSNQGYHAIVDEMDAGVIGERPLVLFDAKAVTKKVSTLMTKVDIKEAESLITEIANRK